MGSSSPLRLAKKETEMKTQEGSTIPRTEELPAAPEGLRQKKSGGFPSADRRMDREVPLAPSSERLPQTRRSLFLCLLGGKTFRF